MKGYDNMDELNRITSFCVDHNKLMPGMYLSRIDGDIRTYDLRFVKPNTPPFLPNPVMHTIEHLFATYARNSEQSENVIYFGPMGCRTGFYFLVRNLSDSESLTLVKDIVLKCINHQGDIPGNTAQECGNYLEHDVTGANKALKEYYEVLKSLKVENLEYNFYS